LYTEFGECEYQCFFHVSQKTVYVTLAGIDVQDRVTDQLTWPVVCPMSAAFYSNDWNAADLSWNVTCNTFADREDMRMLDKD
jgi:hypothetical protein